jgi:hypothetical protein
MTRKPSKEKTMSVTRRELSAMLPGMLIPAISPAKASPQEEKPLPSAMPPY